MVACTLPICYHAENGELAEAIQQWVPRVLFPIYSLGCNHFHMSCQGSNDPDVRGLRTGVVPTS